MTDKLVYVVRHGQTDGNIVEAVQGSDDMLSGEGRLQAERIAERAKDIDFDAILASDYIRAVDTARAIEKTTGKEISFSPHLREVSHPSSLLGVVRGDQRFQAYHHEQMANITNPEWKHSDEENFFDIRERARRAEEEILAHPANVLLVVSHAQFIKCLTGQFIFGDDFTPEVYRRMRTALFFANTGLSLFKYKDGKWLVVTLNDHAHLG